MTALKSCTKHLPVMPIITKGSIDLSCTKKMFSNNHFEKGKFLIELLDLNNN